MRWMLETAASEKKYTSAAKAQAPVIQDIPLQESSDITQTQSDDFWARHPQPEIHMSGEGASYQAETLMQSVPSETRNKRKPKYRISCYDNGTGAWCERSDGR